MTQCQKCQKGVRGAFGTFGTPSVSAFGKIHALLWDRRDECSRVVPVLVCHAEIVVECDAEQAAEAKAWLKKAMSEGTGAVLNGTGKAHVPVQVEMRVADAWRAE